MHGVFEDILYINISSRGYFTEEIFLLGLSIIYIYIYILEACFVGWRTKSQKKSEKGVDFWRMVCYNECSLSKSLFVTSTKRKEMRGLY